MILSQLKASQLDARKARLTETASLLTTIIGEAEMVGKNKRNGAPTNDEVLGVLKKFETNMVENLRIYSERNMTEQILATQKELDTVRLYLPAKLSDEQVKQDIVTVMQQLNLAKEQKSMGPVVKALREKYGAQFDGGQVNAQFKAML